MLNNSSHNFLLLLARLLFSAIFIFSGFGKIFAFADTVGYMQSAGITFYPMLLGTIALVLELGGGLLILLGWHTRIGAAAVFIFTLLVSFMIHHFWSYPADMAQIQMIQFMKNMAILGGALYIFCYGAGAYSIDAKLKK